MKNFFKAVALLTVMAMVLSVSAFAASEAVLNGANIDITVNAGASEEVAILIVKSGAELENLVATEIHYVDQLKTDVNGAAAKSAALINEPVLVDVYMGTGNGAAQLIGEALTVDEIEKITLIKPRKATAIAEGGNNGFGAAIDVVIPQGVAVQKMIWAFKLAGEEGWRFSTAIEDAEAYDYSEGGEVVVEGQVQYAAAFNAVPSAEALAAGIESITVEDFAVIFLTDDEAETVVGADEATIKSYKAE